MAKYNCRFQEICNKYDPNSETCKNDGGFWHDFKAHCGKHRKLEQNFTKKELKKNKFILKDKRLLSEVMIE